MKVNVFPRRLFRAFLSYLIIFIFPVASPAMAGENGYKVYESNKWMLRAMLLDVRTVKSNSNISTIGGDIKTPDKRTVGVDISYFLTPEVALEFQGGVFSRDYSISNSKIGSFKVGTIESNSVSLTLQYHFVTCCAFTPYLGVGANHAWTRKVKPASGIPEFQVQDVNSLILSAGIYYYLSENWSFNTSLRYLISPDYQFEGHGFSASVKMDTIITGVGVAYHF